MATIVVVAGVFALLGGLVYLGRKQEQKRAREMRGAAEGLGWSFAPEQPLDVIPGLERFPLFTQGRNREIHNFMAGERDDVRAAVFDYRYVTGSGKSTAHWRQTVVYLHSPRLDLPAFSLRPENFLHRIGSVFGYQDIDFPERPGFSRSFLLRGSDEAAVRAAFRDGVTGFYEANTGVCTDAEGSELFLWRQAKLAPPGEVPALLERATELLNRLQG